MTQAFNLSQFANNLNTSGQASNGGLQNSSITISPGTGLSGGGAVSLGGSVTINAVGSTINSQTATYTLIAGDAGKTISITTGGVTIPNAIMSAGNIVTIFNNSTLSQTLTQGSGLTLQWAGQTASTTGNRTLGLYGIATIVFISSSLAVITGTGIT